MPVTNPYVPSDLATLLAAREDPDEPFGMRKRMSSLGPRNQDNQYQVYQVTAGLRGTALKTGSTMSTRSSGSASRRNTVLGEVRRSRALELLYAADGGAATCGGFDLFGIGSVPKACAQYIEADVKNRAESRQWIAEGTIRGSPLSLPAGATQLVLGAMYVDHRYSFNGDDIASVVLPDGGPDVLGLGAQDIEGDDSNLDLYVEGNVPLLSGLPAAHRLEVVLGYRHSEYDSAGGIDSWKGEFLYAPVEAVRLRGSYQRAVRAPSIRELYRPQQPDFANFDISELCGFDSPERNGPDSARVEALCIQQGLPVALLPTYSSATIQVVVGGNPVC